jgi:hypothetical protein
MGQIPKAAIGLALAALACAQTADELIAKNTQAHGGLEKLKAIRTLRMTARMQQGGLTLPVVQEGAAPDLFRMSITLQGMTMTTAYDGSSGWRISPFQGRKDPELIGEDDLRGLQDQADFYGPLVDYQTKGNTIEYLGHDTGDGDDAYRLKVTLKNGDIMYYFLDPETFLEIRVERLVFVHGSVRESFTEMGCYKQVDGVYYPFILESGSPQNPGETSKITVDKIEANVPLDSAYFKMPAPAKEKH